MVASQLLVPLAVLVALGTAMIMDLPCAFKTEIPGFCGLIKKAHKVNVATVFNLNGTHFEGVRQNLTKADEALADVLRMKKKSELLAPLAKALESENCALSELKVICNGTKMESGCRLGRRGLQRSSLTLIKAIKKIVNEKQNNTIIAAEEEFLKGRQNGTNLIQDFARNVLKKTSLWYDRVVFAEFEAVSSYHLRQPICWLLRDSRVVRYPYDMYATTGRVMQNVDEHARKREKP
ncbi:unnamed protein product [Nippostrongylus brasiliensis]|uniref:Secreted protein n=1 Tax=Nippostrongylus brasiliensis TaxID=27835 RepID=A0A0N4YE63_NIPBR|nr:unnamed protein product [Nippostrongylus brasiliensis]